MSYDKETRKKRRKVKEQKKRNPYAKSLKNKEFRQRVIEEEKKQNRPLRDTEIIRMYLDELQEEEDANEADEERKLWERTFREEFGDDLPYLDPSPKRTS